MRLAPHRGQSSLATVAFAGGDIAYYKRKQREDKQWCKRASQVWSLTLKMLGPPEEPVMSTKAKETYHLVPLVVEMLQKYEVRLNQYDEIRAPFLLQAGLSMLEVSRIINDPVCQPDAINPPYIV